MERWYRLMGVRSGETKTVWLFFLHNFLLGVGTILVYVTANVILLENHPERNLPLAYLVAALAMLGVGRAYTYYEHHLLLKRLAVRVLLAVVVLTAVIGLLVVLGRSVTAAIMIMTGYRLIYLLTNLEFWGVSAVVFNVRQGRRLFSVISSGDMPAKALGAVLAIFVHAHTALLFLLLTAFGAYLAALYTQRKTFHSHLIEARPGPFRQPPHGTTPLFRQLFGSRPLVVAMGLSLLALAAVTTGVEYFFFVNVKQKLHEQATILRYVGSILALTYLVAMLFKLLLTRHGLDKLGVRWTLLLLPVIVLGGLGLFGGLRLAGVGEAGQLAYFCGLYLTMEVLRRAVFEPVFLLLFQPLSAQERLKGHTLAKGFYEPLGMGVAGALLYGLHGFPALNRWVPFGWMALLLLAALLLLQRTYAHYLDELKTGLSRRFAEAASSTLAWRRPSLQDILGASEELEQPDEQEARVAEAPAGLNQPLASAQSRLARAAPDEGQAGSRAAGPALSPELASTLVNLLKDKAYRPAATESLIRLENLALPALRDALLQETDYPVLRRLALICARLRTAQSRQLLMEVAQQPQLNRRMAALQALSSFAAQEADAPLFQRLVQEEMRRAQLLLHGMLEANVALRACLRYELSKGVQRVFALLLQLYERAPILDAQRGVIHASRERQANALEILDNLIPRPLYRGLQALLDVGRLAEKAQLFDELLGAGPREPILLTILRQGEAAFSSWTISVALRQWRPQPDTVELLYPPVTAPNALLRETAFEVLRQLPELQPAAYQHLLCLYPSLPDLLMSHAPTTSRTTVLERVMVLKCTSLFAQTPENVLSSIVPIMKEVVFSEGEEIFAKGDLGTSLFIIYAGEVSITTGEQQLATFRKGDFFGELALLDAEPRSATALARGPVVAFRLDQEDFYDVMEECTEVLHNILRVLCQRLRLQNEKMQPQSRTQPV